ncbi:MAG: DUF1749 domain-containing protein [Candidatus Aenigmarchaeota archaeon]|nr:DUF1749 domain-containing protein [Candidatus Aenigmarchaeota archaeon]
MERVGKFPLPALMKAELVKFYASDGLALSGLLFKSGRKTKNVIINVFGMTDSFFAWSITEDMVNEIKKNNFDLFLPSNRGLGVVFRFDKKGSKKSLYFGTAKERFEDCIHDIKGSVKAVQDLGYENIILMGHSTGCQKITFYQYKTKDKNVKALVLLAPADDYNIARKQAGKGFDKIVKKAKKMTGKEVLLKEFWGFAPKRFLSFADPENTEAQLFNYDSGLKIFSKIKIPMLAVFGSKEEYAVKPVKTYMEILAGKTRSGKFAWEIIKGANHSFEGREKELSAAVLKWLGSVV